MKKTLIFGLSTIFFLVMVTAAMGATLNDDFNRANETPIGAPYVTYTGGDISNLVSLIDNAAVFGWSPSKDSIMVLNETPYTFPIDMRFKLNQSVSTFGNFWVGYGGRRTDLQTSTLKGTIYIGEGNLAYYDLTGTKYFIADKAFQVDVNDGDQWIRIHLGDDYIGVSQWRTNETEPVSWLYYNASFNVSGTKISGLDYYTNDVTFKSEGTTSASGQLYILDDLFFNYSISGDAVKFSYESDSGSFAFSTAGWVTAGYENTTDIINYTVAIDQCINSTHLIEYYATVGDTISSTVQDCRAIADFCIENTTIYTEYNSSYSGDSILNSTSLAGACDNGTGTPYGTSTDGYNITLLGTTYNGTTYGAVNINDTVQSDFCVSAVTLREYSLSGTDVISSDVDCITAGYGQCLNGACIGDRYAYDTDGGVNYYVSGTTYNGTCDAFGCFNHTSEDDTCASTTILTEYSVTGYSIVSQNYDCTTAVDACYLGACINWARFAVDSDLGININVTGTTYNGTQQFTGNVTENTYTDTCTDSTHVKEYSLNGYNIEYTVIDCVGLGYAVCSLGRCALSYSATPNEDINDAIPTVFRALETNIKPIVGLILIVAMLIGAVQLGVKEPIVLVFIGVVAAVIGALIGFISINVLILIVLILVVLTFFAMTVLNKNNT